MHGFPDWFGWLLTAVYYAPHVLAALAVAVVIYAVRRRAGK